MKRSFPGVCYFNHIGLVPFLKDAALVTESQSKVDEDGDQDKDTKGCRAETIIIGSR